MIVPVLVESLTWSSSLFSKVCKAFDVNPIQRNFINMILPVKVVKSSFF